MACRSSSGSLFSLVKWFPEPESRIHIGSPLAGVCGAAASARPASARACQALGFWSAAALALGAAAALAFAFGAGSLLLLASAT